MGRLLVNPLASQTRVDTDNVRQIHKELRFCWFTFPCLLSHPLPSSFLSWDFWLGYCGCTYLEMPVGGQTAELMGRGEMRERERGRCPREGYRTDRTDRIRGRSEEKGVKAPASLPASSSESSAPGWPTLQTGSLVPTCIIVFVHIVLCMNPRKVKNRHDAPCHRPIYKDKYIYICM